MVQVVGGELGGHSAPREAKSGADHRHRGGGAAHDADHVRRRREHRERDEHERDDLVAAMAGGVRRCAQGRPEHAEHDRSHRDVLAPPGVLAEHAPAEVQQHQQAGGERRLHHHQRHEQQREHLQRPAQHRDARAGQPARSAQQVARQRQAQVRSLRSALGVHRLQRDP